MTTNAQKTIIARLEAEICIHMANVKDGAVGIETPFLDWKGYPVTIYVTVDGRVTDGGNTLNELWALRVIQKYENWDFKDDFFRRYNIVERKNKELEPAETENILSYIQGIARLTYYFKPNPITLPEKEPSSKKKDIYDELTDTEVASFLEIVKNEHSKANSERDEAIMMQAINRLRKNKGGD